MTCAESEIGKLPWYGDRGTRMALALIEEAKPLVSNPVGTQDDREAGMEKLRDSVRGLPWESESILLRLEQLKQEAYRFQRTDVMCNKHLSE
ncbi:hypothetical protein F5146DRAFT_1139565 [Armillaria mellea]|nr:hypothetical protein F5146DRAFT_1139565 [Armillaria mellea]